MGSSVGPCRYCDGKGSFIKYDFKRLQFSHSPNAEPDPEKLHRVARHILRGLGGKETELAGFTLIGTSKVEVYINIVLGEKICKSCKGAGSHVET